jgi:hypothetical protein
VVLRGGDRHGRRGLGRLPGEQDRRAAVSGVPDLAAVRAEARAAAAGLIARNPPGLPSAELAADLAVLLYAGDGMQQREAA